MLGTLYVFVNVSKNSVMRKVKVLARVQKKNWVKFEVSIIK